MARNSYGQLVETFTRFKIITLTAQDDNLKTARYDVQTPEIAGTFYIVRRPVCFYLDAYFISRPSLEREIGLCLKPPRIDVKCYIPKSNFGVVCTVSLKFPHDSKMSPRLPGFTNRKNCVKIRFEYDFEYSIANNPQKNEEVARKICGYIDDEEKKKRHNKKFVRNRC